MIKVKVWPAEFSRLFLVLLLLPTFLYSTSAPLYNPQIDTIISLTTSEKYDLALSVLNDCEPLYAANLYHFINAGILQSRMQDLKTQKWHDIFYIHLDSAIVLSEKEWQQNGEPSALFIKGAAIGYKSFYLAQKKDNVKSLLLAQKSVKILQQVIDMDKQFYDAYVGLGNYYYWRSKILQSVAWLPLFTDKKQEGIDYLVKCAEHGTLSKWAAIANLAWIHIKEKNYENAIQWAEKGLADYPDARSFLWPKGDALFYQKKYTKAEKVYRHILKTVLQCEYNNGYYEILLYLKIAKCLYHQEKYDRAAEYCKKAIRKKADSEVKDACSIKKDEANELLVEITEVVSDKKIEKPRH